MNSATKAMEYEQKIKKDHTLGLANCDNIMGNDAFLLNRMKVSTEIRGSHNPLDAVQNIKGYDAQGNKILINQEAILSGFLSDQGANYEMVGSNKKSVNRMFDRQFENQAVFLNQSYNPHINQMRPTDPRDENLREKDEFKNNNYPSQAEIFATSKSNPNFSVAENTQQNEILPQTCPYCKSMKHIPFLPDGGSVLICQVCQKTFNNIYYNPNNPLVQGSQSPWFSDKFKGSDQQTPTIMQMGGSSPRKRLDQNWNSMQQQHPLQGMQSSQGMQSPQGMQGSVQGHIMQQDAMRPVASRAVQGMRGEGNYAKSGDSSQNLTQNNYANHANNQLKSYRAKFDLDHHSLR